MGVRVKIQLKRDGRVEVTSALVNSGYEAERPEIHVPLALARRLGFKLEELRGETYKVVGAEVITYALGKVEVRVLTEDIASDWVTAFAVMVPGEYEVLLSDALIELLEIEIIKPKSGLWRFKGETVNRVSEEPRYWIE